MSEKISRVQFDEATHTYTVNGTEYPSVTQIIRFLSYDQSKCADQQMALIARERGTEVHEAAALYDYSGDIAEDLSADAAPYLSAYVQFCRDYKPKWNYIEHVIGANRDGIPYGYCGTLDRAGFIDGKCCILDIKTSYKVYPDNADAVAVHLWNKLEVNGLSRDMKKVRAVKNERKKKQSSV